MDTGADKRQALLQGRDLLRISPSSSDGLRVCDRILGRQKRRDCGASRNFGGKLRSRQGIRNSVLSNSRHRPTITTRDNAENDDNQVQSDDKTKRKKLRGLYLLNCPTVDISRTEQEEIDHVIGETAAYA